MSQEEQKVAGIGDVNSSAIGSGARYNSGKARYDLIPTHLLKSTADVFEYGANKYAEWNWAKGMPYSVIIGCLKRHIAAIERGEDVDKESGCRHIGHIMCNALMLEHYMNMCEQIPALKEKFDNRPTMFTKEGLETLMGFVPVAPIISISGNNSLWYNGPTSICVSPPTQEAPKVEGFE